MAKYPYLHVVGTASINGVNPKLLSTLDDIGRNMGKVITVQSGYRSPAYSASVGGYSNDPHSRGEAVDAYVDGKPIGDVVPLATFSRLGLQGGNQPDFYNGKTDPEHVQIPGSGVDKSMMSPILKQATGVTGTGNTPPADLQNGAAGWPSSAALAYNIGIRNGLTPQQAKDFAATQYGESGFNPNARNKDSGAAGLYQLYSQGYVDKANSLGGVYNPKANILAILPDYVSYYKTHPFQPGAAGAAVEKSGKDASYYAVGWQHLPPGLPGQPGDGTLVNQQTQQTTPTTQTPKPPADDTQKIVSMILGMGGPKMTNVLPNLNLPQPNVSAGLAPTNFSPFLPSQPTNNPLLPQPIRLPL